MKIVRKINIIQAVSVVAFVSMVLVSVVLLKNISANVAELTKEDMAMERQVSLISDAYLRQMVSVARILRYAVEGTPGSVHASTEERKIFAEKSEELKGALSETRKLLAELEQQSGETDHGSTLEGIKTEVDTIIADANKYEETATHVFSFIDGGKLHEAEALIAETDQLTNEIGVALNKLDDQMQSQVELAVASIHDAEDALLEDMIIAAVISVLAALGLGYWITLTIRKSLDNTNLTVRNIIQNRDLTIRVPQSQDELGEMAGNFNEMLDAFQGILREMVAASTQLAAAAEELSAVTEESSIGVQKQSSETDQVATAMNEMSATMTEVASNTSSVSQAANHADQQAGEGRQIVLQSINVIHELATEVDKASTVISELSVDSQNIGSVMDVILEIAGQTNLLALNAAIEAARAGEQGRGFAVVADEVRTLAQRTQESTAEIRQTIERLQSRADNAVQVMQAGKLKAEEGVEASSRADESLGSITTAVATINDMVTQIASATEEQSAVAEEINRSLISIRDVSSEVSLGADQTAQASNDIAQLATNMQGMVARYKV